MEDERWACDVQIHLTVAGKNAMSVNWATGELQFNTFSQDAQLWTSTMLESETPLCGAFCRELQGGPAHQSCLIRLITTSKILAAVSSCLPPAYIE